MRMTPSRAHASSHGEEGSITVHSQGGLGNQLFIYGAGLAAAQAAGVRLRIDIGQHAARDDRPSVLERLGFPGEYVDLGFHSSAAEPIKVKIRRKASGKVRLIRGVGPPHGCTWRERVLRYDAAALCQPSGSCLSGYFQSWRYLEPVADEMRHMLERVFSARRDRLESSAATIAKSAGIVLHVRRGDYLAPEALDFHGLAGLPFYSEAVATLRRMGLGGPLFVLSDDVEGAMQELAPLGELKSLDFKSDDALDELLLMSHAPALVIANSSFSWWAAWFGDRPERPVIAPRPWFDDRTLDDRDILPPHWLSLGRRTV